MEKKTNVRPTKKDCFSCPFFNKCPQECRGLIVSGEQTFCPKQRVTKEDFPLDFLSIKALEALSIAYLN